MSILGRSSKLIGGTVRMDLVRDHVRRLILDGFFPVVDRGARPQKRRTTGLRELGLPYAHDPAVTRHLAEFLARHGRAPTAVLFNGGVMKGELLRGRVAEMAGGWQGKAAVPPLWPATTWTWRWPTARPTTAWCAAAGASASAAAPPARTTSASRPPARPSRASRPPVKALCVVPFGMEEGTSVKLPDEELGLVVGETAEFRFFAASDRPGDPPGALLDPERGRAGRAGPGRGHAAGQRRAPSRAPTVPVSLESRLTELGTLELWCVAREPARARARPTAGSWNIRCASGADAAWPAVPRYIIGIDLGTTNTAVAFVDTTAADPRVESFEVPQLVAPGAIDRRRQLPSFVYLAGEHDLAPGARPRCPGDGPRRRRGCAGWWWASWRAARGCASRAG